MRLENVHRFVVAFIGRSLAVLAIERAGKIARVGDAKLQDAQRRRVLRLESVHPIDKGTNDCVVIGLSRDQK